MTRLLAVLWRPLARRLDDFDAAVTDALNILDDNSPPPPPRLEVRRLTAGGYAVWCWDCHRWLLDGQTTLHGPVVASWVSGHEMAHEMQVTR